ncbi:LD-carboxypeptidase LdcB/DacB [Streptococcus cuniculi]|uniref:D-alanyl-D-alanine carboxypeptidase family protein n=1 Tax=Streptococcus cuniculi TaxID=1432788 RepID=A0A4Y9JBV5_9STRE|nr:LD-carboxypeptidase LdcB/DacB [Streptococcus cuniculi]MBF0777839.1 M15 family metallopeptidase [Streptococcus cuniculi]TFU98473.1 D-alanyl-D-alanine carboxypeptidase family protein [Streptococcus cuniculi]
MKYRQIICLLSLCSLVACGQAKSKGTEGELPVSSSQQMTDTSSETGAMTQDTRTSPSEVEPQFNGSYYSVQGKYGEVLIANKRYPLSSDYAPGEIPEALSAFQELVAKMQSLGYDVSTVNYSGFRSYETQTTLYQSYVARDGKDEADRYSARAGYSEHQTGLAYDIIDTSGSLLTEPHATKWLAEHAHHYGFIVRYPPGKEASTGYMPESWHIRYIGKEASDIYQSGQTLEEYFGVSGGGYEN